MSFSLPGLSPLGGGSPSSQSPALPGLTPLNDPAPAAPAAPHPAAPAAPAPNPINNTPGTAGYGMDLAGYQAGVQQNYGGQINNAQQQIGNWNGYFNTANQDIGNMAQANINQTNAQAQGQQGVLEGQRASTQSQRNLSLAELADQIHGQNQGLMNQLGAAGAGFSSAVQTGQQALQHAQNTQAANVNEQANAALLGVNKNEDEVEGIRKTGIDSINAWKSQQLNNILSTYTQQITQLNNAITSAQGAEKADLARYGAALTQGASDALNQLQNATNGAITAHQQMLAQNQNQAAPSAQFKTYAAPNPITINTQSPFQPSSVSQGNATSNAGGPTLAGLAQGLKQDNNQ